MKPWEIWTYDPGFGDHLAVIITHPARVAHKPVVEFLLCSSQRAGRPPTATEVLLDHADGLNWETLCKCDLIRADEKSKLHTPRGAVSPDRRIQIIRTMIRSHAWTDSLL